MPPTPPTSAPDFASSLRRFRLARGLSQEELAAKAGISVTSVSYLERGLTRLPHRDTVQLLAAALALTAEEYKAFLQAARRARSDEAAEASQMPLSRDGAAAGEQSAVALPSYRLAPPLTPLLGRAREEATVVGLLARESVRLLTLTGPAGVGKTRLALQAADSLREQQDVELVFVDLVAVAQADRVLQAVGLALGVRDAGGLPLLDAIISAMGERRLLLVLDNFEHVLAAAPVCAALLGACPRAKALATSRAALNIRGEHEVVVSPLPVPDVQALPPLAELEQFGAVALFVERARAIRHDFALATAEQGRLAATVCARLDGLPLAIELAAAQVKHFLLPELAARLAGIAPLDLLVGGPRDLADHQRAMRSTVAWGYELLSAEERMIFRALGVFPGGAAVDGLVAVASLDQEVIASCLASLIEANLVRRVSEQGEPRYDLLVIVRAYALERLRDEGELDAVRRRFIAYVTNLIDTVSLTSIAVQTEALNRLVREHDNIRAVLDWVLESNEIQIGLRLCAKLRQFWELRGFAVEGAVWMERLLARAAPPRDTDEIEARAVAWKVLMILNHRLSRFQRAAEAGERALALARRQGDAMALGNALNNLANPVTALGDFDRGEALYQESLAIYRAHGNRAAEETSLLNLGELRMWQRRFDEALVFHDEALAISQSLGFGEREGSRALILSNKGETLIMMDRPDEARAILLESQRLYEEYNQPIVLALNALGRACWRLGDFADALADLERSMRQSRRQDDVASLAQALCIAAGVAFAQGDMPLAWQVISEASIVAPRVSDRKIQWRVIERGAALACRQRAWGTAARLYAAAERGRDALRDLIDPAERELRASDRAAMLDALGEEAYADATRVGQALSLEYAIELTREALATPPGGGN